MHKRLEMLEVKNIYQVFIKAIVAVACMVLMMVSGYAQQKELVVVNKNNIGPDAENIVGLDEKGDVISYKIINGAKLKFLFKTSVQSFTTEALSFVNYNKTADRILVFGDKLLKHENDETFAFMYNSKGGLIKNLGSLGTWPFVGKLTNTGDFIYAGNSSLYGTKMLLAKIDKSGLTKWKINLENYIPVGLFSSPKGNLIAVVLYNSQATETLVKYYTGAGVFIRKDNSHSGVESVEFITDEKVLVTSGNNW